jgi:excisionase family DNA binding protein
MTKLLTANEVAELLGVKLPTIRALTQRRRIPFVRIAGMRAVRFRPADIQALIDAHVYPAEIV